MPIQIELAGKEYLDGIDLDKNSFFEMLEESGEFPLTSQPSPQVFLDIFQEVKEQGDDLICILLSSHLSGTYQTAQLARQMADCEDHIFLIDSRAATYNIKVMADYALELVREGLSAAEIAEKLEKFKSRVKVVAMIDTGISSAGRTDWKSGRCGRRYGPSETRYYGDKRRRNRGSCQGSGKE